MSEPFNIFNARHPLYSSYSDNWILWRDAYNGGDTFIRSYLEKYSRRESEDDFAKRKKISYLPSFAKTAINEIKDSIFQRMTDISRINGPASYRDAVAGNSGGVDNEGTDMNTFIGQVVLPELLVMRRVGVYVDMDAAVGENLAEQIASQRHPYIYAYKVEDILDWRYRNTSTAREFSMVVLRDYVNEIDEATDLHTGEIIEQCRHIWIGTDGFVHVQFYDADGSPVNKEKTLPLKHIPFDVAEISNSLMEDIARHQIALLNLASSDLLYALHSNFPFYVEQGDNLNFPSHLKQEGTASTESTQKKEIDLSPSGGRIYPKNTDQPAFIHPSPEPLQVSMQKQEAIKTEIRQLVKLAVSNLQPKMASAESKGMDSRGLEAGLSYIGLELQRLERLIATRWAAYENTEPAEVNYPEKYMLKTDDERWAEAKELSARIGDSPSLSYRKEICKRIARIMLWGKVSLERLQKIEDEIEASKVILPNDVNYLLTVLQNGVLSTEGAAAAGAIPESEPKKAASEHAERLKRIQEAQAPKEALTNPAARGVNDLAADTSGAKKEKQ